METEACTTIVTPPLSHIFTVLYKDGTSFIQPDDDHCSAPRLDGTGSAFTDVDVANVVVMFLESGIREDDPDKHLYLVDLRTGFFEINDAAFQIGDDNRQPRHLRYFRRVAHERTTNMNTGAVEYTMRRHYCLGFTQGGVDHIIEVGHEVFHGL